MNLSPGRHGALARHLHALAVRIKCKPVIAALKIVAFDPSAVQRQ